MQTIVSKNKDALLLSVADAGQRLSLGRTTIYALITANDLATVRIGRRTLITAKSVKRIARSGAAISKAPLDAAS